MSILKKQKTVADLVKEHFGDFKDWLIGKGLGNPFSNEFYSSKVFDRLYAQYREDTAAKNAVYRFIAGMTEGDAEQLLAEKKLAAKMAAKGVSDGKSSEKSAEKSR